MSTYPELTPVNDIKHVIRYLVLFVTGRCNLCCRYCYARNLSIFGAIGFETAVAAVNLCARTNQRFHIQFTGGEPTLESDLMERICEFVSKKSVKCTLGIQTNGTLIDASISRMFKKYQIEVGLSIDGVPAIHNQHRSRFRDTIRGLDMLANHDIPCRVTAVVTMENVLHLGKLALMLSGFPNVKGVALDLLVNKGNAVQNRISCANPECLKKGAYALKQMLEVVNSRRENPLQFRELDVNRRSCSTFCHAVMGQSMAVLPNGRVYPCSQTAGDLQFDCGSIDNVHWDFLPMRINGCDCSSRTHYNRSDNLILHAALQRALSDNFNERILK